MRKPLLAATVAAAVAATTVTAPSALAQDGTEDASSLSSELSSASSSSEDGEGLSPGAIAGITLGVLAAVGAGGAFAVQQGWVKLPPQVADAARKFGIPVGPSPAQKPAPRPAGNQKRGSCDAAQFDRLVPGWPNFTGTVVNYCDGQWAVASANQTDWFVRFRFVGDRWTVVPTDGVKLTGMRQGCYNGIKLRNQGAPEEFMRRTPICTPAEIGARA
ncbi:hypothetical protein [Corynebacterium sp. Marseille-P4321]|uniref:hypothetical protein n=1 Tax=Corynebacterium sp. Marseille-P4321 TaxID=2736603 RepID=UPI00158ED1CC|nr:hypothetical protein [Corynebacterium sp. Marseille-P4321]